MVKCITESHALLNYMLVVFSFTNNRLFVDGGKLFSTNELHFIIGMHVRLNHGNRIVLIG